MSIPRFIRAERVGLQSGPRGARLVTLSTAPTAFEPQTIVCTACGASGPLAAITKEQSAC